MPISGLILTLCSDPDAAQSAILKCHEDPRIEVGQCVGLRRCPITLTTESQDEDKACWQALQDDPGIDHVDVACVFFDDDQADDSPHKHLSKALTACLCKPNDLEIS